MVLLIAGIPVVAFLAWVFQITDGGIKTEVVGMRGGLAITIALSILLAGGALLFQQLETVEPLIDTANLSTYGSVTQKPVATIVVMPFSASDKYETLSRSFTIELSERLSRHADLFVVSPGSTYSPLLASIGPAL